MMFKNLGAPARLGSGVIAFSFCKPESTKKFDCIREKATRTAKGMMVVIAPTQTHGVLAPLLYPSGKVAEFPVDALFSKKEIACDVDSDERNDFFLCLECMRDARSVIGKIPPSRLPQF